MHYSADNSARTEQVSRAGTETNISQEKCDVAIGRLRYYRNPGTGTRSKTWLKPLIV
jgi:hypothetical protein